MNNNYGYEYIKLNKLSLLENSSIHYNFNGLDFFYKTNIQNKNLVISFHAAANASIKRPIFYTIQGIANADILSFSDPIYNIDPNIELGWFLKHEQNDTPEQIKEIINFISHKYANIICYGSSGGGLISLMMSSIFKCYALVCNSQFYIQPKPNVSIGYKYASILKKQFNLHIDIDIEKYLLEYGLPKKMYIYQNIYDETHYKDHYVPFKNFVTNSFTDSNNYEFIEFTRDDIGKCIPFEIVEQHKNTEEYDKFTEIRSECIRQNHCATIPLNQFKKQIIENIVSQRECPICNNISPSMLNFGNPTRTNAQCSKCYSLERHRLMWLYLMNEKNILETKYDILHIAPEYCIQNKLSKLSNIKYVSIDLFAKNVSMNMDITDLKFENNTFDVIICNHVLEHVEDDRTAMSELYRVLKPGGFAILMVPVSNKNTTYENPEAKTKEDRLKFFGQHDHVRIYGRDYTTRLENIGFKVETNNYIHTIGEVKMYYHCITNETLYIGYKTI